MGVALEIPLGYHFGMHLNGHTRRHFRRLFRILVIGGLAFSFLGQKICRAEGFFLLEDDKRTHFIVSSSLSLGSSLYLQTHGWSDWSAILTSMAGVMALGTVKEVLIDPTYDSKDQLSNLLGATTGAAVAFAIPTDSKSGFKLSMEGGFQDFYQPAQPYGEAGSIDTIQGTLVTHFWFADRWNISLSAGQSIAKSTSLSHGLGVNYSPVGWNRGRLLFALEAKYLESAPRHLSGVTALNHWVPSGTMSVEVGIPATDLQAHLGSDVFSFNGNYFFGPFLRVGIRVF